MRREEYLSKLSISRKEYLESVVGLKPRTTPNMRLQGLIITLGIDPNKVDENDIIYWNEYMDNNLIELNPVRKYLEQRYCKK